MEKIMKMLEEGQEILMTDIIEYCVKQKNFSCAFIQKTFEMPYPIAGRLLDACVEAGVLDKTFKLQMKSVKEYKQNYEKVVEALRKRNLF